MSSATDFYQSDQFQTEINQCQIFRLKYPKGGHYNDGWELLGNIECCDASNMLQTLSILGVPVILHNVKPKCFCPPPIIVNGVELWVEYENYNVIEGTKVYITIRTTDFTLEFNLNSISWYEVTLEDVKTAQSFEKKLTKLKVIV